MIRVLVVDDQQLIREGIASLLRIQERITVVGTASDGQEAIEKTLALSPDIVLMDVRMPVLDGVKATAEICKRVPACQVLMLTTFADENYVVEALQSGAKGYLLKDIPVDELAQAIRLAHAGIYQLDPAAANKLMVAVRRTENVETVASTESNPTASLHTVLTDREIDVLRLLALGATNREIATQLVVTEGTIKNHVSNILNRLGLRDRTQAALYARDHDLL